jgi:hypothetical protein
MRCTFIMFLSAALISSAAFAQTPANPSPDRTFYLTQATTPQDLTTMATLLRTVVGIQEITPDPARKALVTNGTVDQMMLTEWLVQQLDRPVTAQAAGTPTPEYRMAGTDGDLVRVFRLDSSATNADLTAIVTAIRTVADAQRMFPYFPQRAVIARSSSDRVEAAEWIFHQLYPPPGQTPSAASPAYQMDNQGHPEVVRVFRIDPAASNQTLVSLLTAIRTIADIQRLFPFESQKALIMRGTAEKVAAAEWLVNELGKPADPSQRMATHAYSLPDIASGIPNTMRVFYLANRGSAADLTTLANEIRTIGIQRVFPVTDRRAVALLSPPDKIATLETMVTKFDGANK